MERPLIFITKFVAPSNAALAITGVECLSINRTVWPLVEGLPGGEPTVHLRSLGRAFDEDADQVIRVQVDHAGRRHRLFYSQGSHISQCKTHAGFRQVSSRACGFVPQL